MTHSDAHPSPTPAEGEAGEVIAFPTPHTTTETTTEATATHKATAEPANSAPTAKAPTTEDAVPGVEVDVAPIEGEIVDDSTTATPGAVSEVEDLGPLLPAWASSPEAFKAHLAARARKVGHGLAWHGVRSPKYVLRITVYTTRGAAMATAHVVGYMAAADYNDIIHVEKQAGQRQMAIDHARERKEERARRAKALGITAAVGTAAVGITTVVFGPWVLAILASVLMLGAYMLGRPHDEQAILEDPQMPVRLDLAPDHLNDAFRAAGLLKGEDTALTLCAPILRDGQGWAATVDLPRGGGKTAKDVLARRDAIAAELGVDEIQLIMGRVRAAAGGHAGRLALWVADDDPYIGKPNPSPLLDMDQCSIWKPVPYGRDARGNRITLQVIWESMFFGGLPRRGKTFSQRLLTAAALLDPYVRHYVADFKGGADWVAMRKVAHRLVVGAEESDVEKFKHMLTELLTEMEQRFKKLRDLPASICPEGKLTPEISRTYNMPIVFVTIDELQELFVSIDDKTREQFIDWLCRLARRGPAAGFVCNFASQRPDAQSVPTKLREIITVRYCTQVIDRPSSDMVLGKGKAAQGADASMLSEDHQGVGVLVTGPDSHVIVKVDLLDGPAFVTMCERGRALRAKHQQLTGDAVDDVQAGAEEAGVMIHPLVTDVLEVMRSSDRMFSEDILDGLVNIDEDTYGDYDTMRLARELETAGVNRTAKQVKIAGINRAGYRRADVEAAVPVDIFATHPEATPDPDHGAGDTTPDEVEGDGPT